MNTKNTNNSLFQKDQLKASLKQSFVKLNPRLMVKNPIMFTVEIATFFMLPVTVYSAVSGAQGSVIYNFSVFIDGGQTFYDFTVCRNDIPCFTLKDIAFLQLGTAYRLQLSICDPLGRCFLTSFAQAVSLSLAPCFGDGFRKVGKKQGQKKNDENAEVIDYRALCTAYR